MIQSMLIEVLLTRLEVDLLKFDPSIWLDTDTTTPKTFKQMNTNQLLNNSDHTLKTKKFNKKPNLYHSKT